MQHKLSIVIPTLNEEYYIRNLLDDLTTQEYQPHEIIVVDGSSTDKTVSIVKQFPHVTLLHMKPQVARQRNRGAQHATGDIVVFLDADTEVSKHFLSSVNASFQKHSLDLACPLYLPSQFHLPSLAVYLLFNVVFITVQKLMPCGAGSCIIVKKRVFEELDGFEHRYTFDDMQFLSKSRHRFVFKTLLLPVYVSNRRIKKYGFFKSMVLYLRLSWYFVRNDYTGANKVTYPFGIYPKK